MITLLLTYADGDQLHTRFNGSKRAAIEQYRQNNQAAKVESIKVSSILFVNTNHLHRFPKKTAAPEAVTSKGSR